MLGVERSAFAALRLAAVIVAAFPPEIAILVGRGDALRPLNMTRFLLNLISDFLTASR
jgi:hypothetical protein